MTTPQTTAENLPTAPDPEPVEPRPIPPKPVGRTDWEFVTPERAEELLAAAAKQRRLLPSHEGYLAAEIQRGWEHENPQVIIIGQSGDTIEGQHRLRAIVRSGIGIWLNIARNVPDRVFEVLDTGRPRRTQDIFSISYRDINSSALASGAALLWRYTHDQMLGNKPRKSPQQYKDFIQTEHPGLVRCLDNPRALTKLLPPGPAAFCRYIFSTLDLAMTATFLLDVGSGEGERETPARELRERLLTARGARRPIRAEEKCAWAIKAWNAYREARTIQVLSWKPKQEGFPEAK